MSGVSLTGFALGIREFDGPSRDLVIGLAAGMIFLLSAGAFPVEVPRATVVMHAVEAICG